MGLASTVPAGVVLPTPTYLDDILHPVNHTRSKIGPMSEPFERPAPIPPRLRASVERHEINLARLMTSLRQAGMDDRTIETSVSTIIESYRRELMDVVKSLATSHHAPSQADPP